MASHRSVLDGVRSTLLSEPCWEGSAVVHLPWSTGMPNIMGSGSAGRSAWCRR